MKQVRSIQPLTIGGDGGTTHGAVFTTSVKAAKNLFIISAAYFINYIPLLLTTVPGMAFTPWYVFGARWLYWYSGAVNAFLYIILNRSVKNELKLKFFFWQTRRDTSERQSGDVVVRSRDRRSNPNPSSSNRGDPLIHVDTKLSVQTTSSGPLVILCNEQRII